MTFFQASRKVHEKGCCRCCSPGSVGQPRHLEEHQRGEGKNEVIPVRKKRDGLNDLKNQVNTKVMTSSSKKSDQVKADQEESEFTVTQSATGGRERRSLAESFSAIAFLLFCFLF